MEFATAIKFLSHDLGEYLPQQRAWNCYAKLYLKPELGYVHTYTCQQHRQTSGCHQPLHFNNTKQIPRPNKANNSPQPHSITYYSLREPDFKDTNSEKHSILSLREISSRNLASLWPRKRALCDPRWHILIGKNDRMMNIKINEGGTKVA